MDVAFKLAALERMIDYVFVDKILGIESLNTDGQPIHYNGNWLSVPKNDRIAVVGDKALDMVLCTLWFKVPDAHGRLLEKVSWSGLQGDLVTNPRLAERGFSLELDSLVVVNPGHHGQISPKMMATTFEAIVGAVYIDSKSLEVVRKVMIELGFFENHPLLVTYNHLSPLACKNIQMITDVQFLDPG